MNSKKPMDMKEVTVKVELPLKIFPLKIEFKYKKHSYKLNLKPDNSKVIILGDGKISIIRCLNDGSIRWAVMGETVQFGEL